MKNQSFEVLCHKQMRNARKGSKEKSAMKHSWWQSCQPLLEHFLKSNLCMLYVVSKLRKSIIQCFKRFIIWSWNEGFTAIASRSLQAEGRFLQGYEISLLLREFRSHFAQCTGVLLKLPDSCDMLEAEHRKLKANFAALRNQPFAAKWFRSPFWMFAKSRRPRFHLRNGP